MTECEVKISPVILIVASTDNHLFTLFKLYRAWHLVKTRILSFVRERRKLLFCHVKYARRVYTREETLKWRGTTMEKMTTSSHIWCGNLQQGRKKRTPFKGRKIAQQF